MYQSQAVLRVLGYAPESMTGDSTYRYTHPDDHEAARGEHAQLIAAAKSTLRSQRRYRHADGNWRTAADVWPVRLDASRIVTQNGGRIRLHSELGTGTTFETDLPRHP